MMAAPGAGGEGAAAAEEKTEFDVVLEGFGDKKIGVIKVVRAATSLGLKEAKELSDYLENPFNFVSMRQRFEGYRQALVKAKIAYRDDYHLQGQLGGREAGLFLREAVGAPMRDDQHLLPALRAASTIRGPTTPPIADAAATADPEMAPKSIDARM